MRFRQAAVIIGAFVGCISVAACGIAADLPWCANRYGNLMVKHWMTVSSLQQLERLLYYQGELDGQTPIAVRYRKLQQDVDGFEQDSNRAAERYAALFKAEPKEGVEKLGDELERLSAVVLRQESTVLTLLGEAGKKAAGATFEAVPDIGEQIKRAWDTRSLVDEKHRPKRILFGSTGHIGDDRILPLEFDFGSGLHSFFIPMTARDTLAAACAAGRADR